MLSEEEMFFLTKIGIFSWSKTQKQQLDISNSSIFVTYQIKIISILIWHIFHLFLSAD